MTARNPTPQVAVSVPPARRPQPIAGRDATVGQPFGRIIRNPPSALLARARRHDLALNQIRRQSVAPDWTERFCWAALSVLAVVSFWLVISA